MHKCPILHSAKNPRISFEKSRGVTSASRPYSPISLWTSWPPSNPHICWLGLSLCLLSTNKLVCGEHSDAIWLPSHHPGGCCTLVVNEEIPPLLCKAIWVSRKALYKCSKLLITIIILFRMSDYWSRSGCKCGLMCSNDWSLLWTFLTWRVLQS